MREFCGLSSEEIKKNCLDLGEKPFRSKQLTDWVYQKGILDPSKMGNLSKVFKEKLEKDIVFSSLNLCEINHSDDEETLKFLWRIPSGNLVESVLISSGSRRTVCISSQVGCPVRCAFCASGKKGLIQNLSAGQIVEQVVRINQFLYEKGERVSHLVFMGMGEPLENYEAVIKAIKILIDKNLYGISPRRITLSTAGVVPAIGKLLNEKLNINLALSLHAPNQQIRKRIIPYARKYQLNEVLSSVRTYAKDSKRDITYEYILIEGLNDAKKDALELAQLIKNDQCTVNLIPYNPVLGITFKRPPKERIEAFRDILVQKKIKVTWRYTKGKDIAAACGQLAIK